MSSLKFLLLPLVFGIATAGQAGTVITFEEAIPGVSAMSNSPGSAVPLASRLSNQYLTSSGVSFTSTGGYAALVDHGAGNPTASFPNIIAGSSSAGTLDYNAPILIEFFDPASPASVAVTSSFKIQGDWAPLGSGGAVATAYDIFGNVLGSTSDTDNKPAGVAGVVLAFNISGIHAVSIQGDNGTIGFDQLEFGALSRASGSVPLPGSLALLASGLLAGLGMRLTASREKEI